MGTLLCVNYIFVKLERNKKVEIMGKSDVQGLSKKDSEGKSRASFVHSFIHSTHFALVVEETDVWSQFLSLSVSIHWLG